MEDRHELGRAATHGRSVSTAARGRRWVGRPDGTALPARPGAASPCRCSAGSSICCRPPRARRRRRPARSGRPPRRRDALRLLFPPPQAVLSDDGPVTLRAMGGRRPLTFLMDGAPLPTDPARRETAWNRRPGLLPPHGAGRRRHRRAAGVPGEVTPIRAEVNMRFELQGHRGARGLFPENTVGGFAATVALGVDAIELDIAVTASRQPLSSCRIAERASTLCRNSRMDTTFRFSHCREPFPKKGHLPAWLSQSASSQP